jgi:trk system potassium uptake protein TrkA
MYVVVIGLGEVGRHTVRVLEQDRHDIVVVDVDPEALRWAEENHDVGTLEGYGASPANLRAVRVGSADLVVAVTDNDEVNLIAALASKRAGAKQTIARVQQQEWASEREGVSYGLLGVDVVINPRVLLAQAIAQIARSHGALEVVDLADDRIELIQVALAPGSRMLDKPLAKLTMPDATLVAAIVRNGELRVPGGADVLLVGDRVYLIGRTADMEAAADLFSAKREAKRVCIVGGGVVGRSLAIELLRTGSDVMVIEHDRAAATDLAGCLDGATVVHGDGTNLELLIEEHIERFDMFAAVTHEDEVNLMACLLAKRLGDVRAVCLAHRADYASIYRQLGVDIVLSPRVVAGQQILRYCRQSELKSLTVLEDGQAEVLEIVAQPTSRSIGVPLRRLNVPRGALVAAIVRGSDVIVPGGEDAIEVGDTVVLMVTNAARTSVARLFKQRSF